MNPIEIISASAGSGKTYRLAEILLDSLESEEVRPEAVVAVTFTTKAAAELQERARQALIEKGRLEDAHRLAASRIGTVNSVFGGLLREFAFDMGLSPEQNILDEAAAASGLLRARSLGAERLRGERFAQLKTRMRSFEWDDATREVINKARANDLSPADLKSSRDRSIESMQEVLATSFKDPAPFMNGVARALTEFLKNVDPDDSTGDTKRACTRARSALTQINDGKMLDWDAWAGLAHLKTGAKSREAAESLTEAAAEYFCLPGFREDLETATKLVFDAAADALESYKTYKEERGAVDFGDQLTLSLRALRRPEIRQQLEGEIDLFLVDEFQDTSPLQLAIFLEIAQVAKRTVWVGDQKQSIFGFIDTDPVLMDSAIRAILGDTDPETLPKSYRSRPELVRLTSDLFAPAFEQVDIPAKRTHLEPAFEEEPKGLGPIVERWRIDAGRKKVEVAAALATGVQELLDDPKAKVRGGNPKKARKVEPSDIAILCRSNNTCLQVAGGLAALGIPCVVARRGLLSTPEAQLVLAGLKRWIDSRDSLAAASLARLAAYPADGESWLEEALRSPNAEGFAELEIVRRIDHASRASAGASVLEVFDGVVEAVEASAQSCTWGSSEQRQANLDALRSLAVAYLNLRASEGVSASLSGLVIWLSELEGAGEDELAMLAGSGAVVVSTWHSAKGLEWPVTVLFDLDFKYTDTAFGVNTVQDGEGFNFSDPLAKRWLRYWPNPFNPRRTKSYLHERVREHAASLAIAELDRREQLRLLYVGWTRARDRVVLVSRAKKDLGEVIDLLRDSEGALLSEPAAEEVTWAGRKVQVGIRTLSPIDAAPLERVGGSSYVVSGPADYAAASASPSYLTAEATLGAIENIGDGVPFAAGSDMTAVGEAVHGFFAADREGLSGQQRRDLAQTILSRWKVDHALLGHDLVRASDDLRHWVERRWPEAPKPGARWHREWPIRHRLETGTIIHGSADLVLERADGFVIIDHKSYLNPENWDEERVAALAGQLGAYADAIAKATGLEPLGSWVHLPLAGSVVRLEL